MEVGRLSWDNFCQPIERPLNNFSGFLKQAKLVSPAATRSNAELLTS